VADFGGSQGRENDSVVHRKGEYTRLLTACTACGHSGHADCYQYWFGSGKGAGCPTEGCLCSCVGGGVGSSRDVVV
jgi:hypothetical protein